VGKEKAFCRVCDSTRHVEEWRLKNGESVYLCLECWQRGYLKGLLLERVKHNSLMENGRRAGNDVRFSV
jgi:hypothetical protein